MYNIHQMYIRLACSFIDVIVLQRTMKFSSIWKTFPCLYSTHRDLKIRSTNRHLIETNRFRFKINEEYSSTSQYILVIHSNYALIRTSFSLRRALRVEFVQIYTRTYLYTLNIFSTCRCTLSLSVYSAFPSALFVFVQFNTLVIISISFLKVWWLVR